MRKILISLLFAPILAFAQTFPVQNLQVNGNATGLNGTGPFTITTGATVTGSFTATGLVTNADLAVQAANTVLANVTAGTASPSAATLPLCSTSSNALLYTSGAGFSCNTAINAATVSGGFPVRTIGGTTTSDTVLSTDVVINWNSTASSNKAETFPACSGTNSGKVYIVKDEAATSLSFPITITPASGTIEKSANFLGAINSGSWTFICDGVSNWTAN